jgi:ankyrin repeat protein
MRTYTFNKKLIDVNTKRYKIVDNFFGDLLNDHCKAFITLKEDPSLVNVSGCFGPPIQYIRLIKNMELVSLIVELTSSDYSELDHFGNHFIHELCLNGQVDHIKILLKHKYRFDIKSKSGLTPLKIAENTRNQSVIDLLR